MQNKRKKGLTLMELTIVLAILAIIAAILIPMFIGTTDRARLRSDIQSARVIQNAMDLFLLERGQAVTGATPAIILTNLEQAGYLNLRHHIPQTQDALWLISGGVVSLDIRPSPTSIRNLYSGLNPAERAMVTN